jgi:hypothetical protein
MHVVDKLIVDNIDLVIDSRRMPNENNCMKNIHTSFL